MDDAQEGLVPRAATRRRVLTLAAGAGLVSLGGVIGATFIKSPEELRAEADGPEKSVLTASVEKRVLTSTVIARGEVRATHQVEVTPTTAQGAAIAVVTGLFSGIGSRVQSGDVLLSVSGRPLIALPGPLPAYRDLRPGDSGADVQQLQDALRAQKDYSGSDRKGYFGSATKVAIRRLYRRIGYAVPDTGGPNARGDLPALRAAADAVADARRQVSSLKEQTAGNPDPVLLAQLDDAKKRLARAQDDQSALIATTGPMMPMAEVAFLPSLPASVIKLSAAVGQPVQAPLIVLSSGTFEVGCRMRPDQAAALRVGMTVQIVSESLGANASGSIASIGPLSTADQAGQAGATAEAGQTGAAYRYVAVTPTQALGNEWSGLDVRVTITAAESQGEVLVVPISALNAGADGRITVNLVADYGKQTLIEVRPGISGDGYVEVTPISDELIPGSRVVIGQ